MAPKWGEDMTVKFVELYRDRQCLWDQRHELYKNTQARRSSLSEMVYEMNIEGFGVAEAKNKIKILRGTYHIEIAKQNKSITSGSNEIYMPTLKWLHIMHQVMKKGRIKKQTPSSIKPDPFNTSMTEDTYYEPVDSPSNLPQQERAASEPREEEDPLEIAVDFEQKTIDGPLKKSKPQSKIQKTADTARELKLLCDSIARSTPVVDENEFDIFGKHVAAQLKKLSTEQTIMAEMEINNILTKCRFADLNREPPQSSICFNGLQTSNY